MDDVGIIFLFLFGQFSMQNGVDQIYRSMHNMSINDI